MSASVEALEQRSGLSEMDAHLIRLCEAAGGALAFDAFMREALYAPGLGYYARGDAQFGHVPSAAKPSDFVTAPTLSSAFGATVARQVAQVLDAVEAVGGERCITEFGAGTGALMLQIMKHWMLKIPGQRGEKTPETQIMELSAALRARQQSTLGEFATYTRWLDAWPDVLEGVIVGNEVLDAMPCKLLARLGDVWHERHVAQTDGAWAWQDLPTSLRPPLEPVGQHDYITEIHPEAEAFIASLAERMLRGQGAAAIFIDYGFGEREYYHPQRHMGTLMCHQGHRSDPDPLSQVGEKDITCHVNFTGIALAAQNADLDVVGYTSQGRFLLNCGLLEVLADASLPERANAQKLVTEHEMGELFKVIALCTPNLTHALADCIGFAVGDRTHTL